MIKKDNLASNLEARVTPFGRPVTIPVGHVGPVPFTEPCRWKAISEARPQVPPLLSICGESRYLAKKYHMLGFKMQKK
jgi:hypothetical protein